MANPKDQDFGDYAKHVPGAVDDDFGDYAKHVPKATAGGALKNLGASAIEGVGSIAQGGLELGAGALNSALNTQRFSGFNPLKGVADRLKDSMSAGDKAAMADQAKGDVLKPDTWTMPQTAGGYIHSAANVLGSLAPTVATAFLTRGNMGPAMAAQGGLMTGGAAAGDVRENIEKLDDAKLAEAAPRVRELLAAGFSPADARAKVTNESAQMSGLLAGGAGALGGAVNARLLEDLIAKKGIPALLGQKFANQGVARTVIGAGLGGLGEGLQETAEKVGQNAGENVGMGKSLGDDVTRDTFGDFVGGAIGGKMTGGVGGYLSKPTVTTPSGGQIDPTAGPISSAAATAINSGASQRTADTQAQEQAAQQQQTDQAAADKQQGEMAKAMSGKPEHTDPQQWFDSLNGTGQRTLIEKLEGDERQTALDLMTMARNPEASDAIRSRSAEMLFNIAQSTGFPGVRAPVSPLALPAPKKDNNQQGRDNIAKWSAESQALTLNHAQELQRRAAADGRDDMVVVPHTSGQGYTIVPQSWTGQAVNDEAKGIQGKGSGQLPSPNTPRAGTMIAGKGGVRQQTYGDLDTTANRAISEASATLGDRKAQSAQVIRNAEPTSDVSTKVKPGALEGEYIRGRQTAEQYFPFKNAQQAETRAMTATKEFGEEYGVEPHPSVKGAFAVVPASKAAAVSQVPPKTSRLNAPSQAAESGKQTGGESNGATAGFQDSARNPQILPQKQKNQLFRESPISRGLSPQIGETRNIAESAVKPIENKALSQKLIAAPVDEAAQAAATSPLNKLPEPMVAQQKAGNYVKGHVKIGGLDISVENPSGSTRSGTDADGKAWNTTMRDHYGYIKRTTGADKDQVDAFIKGGTAPDHSGDVFVIDQVSPGTGKFDEHKAMIGYRNMMQAAAAYRAHYAKGWKGMGAITPMPIAEFKAWVQSPEASKPLALENKPDDDPAQPVAPPVRDERVPSDSAVAPDKPTGSPDSAPRSVIGANKRARVADSNVSNSAASVPDASQPQSDGAGVAATGIAEHIEEGEAEQATPSAINASLKTGDANSSKSMEELRQGLLADIDAKLKDAPTLDALEYKIDKDGDVIPKYSKATQPDPKPLPYVVFDVPGDGKFKVQATQENLTWFRKEVAANKGFSKYKGTPQAKPTNADSTTTTLHEMLVTPGEYETAYNLAQLKDKPLGFAITQSSDRQSVKIAPTVNDKPVRGALAVTHYEPTISAERAEEVWLEAAQKADEAADVRTKSTTDHNATMRALNDRALEELKQPYDQLDGGKQEKIRALVKAETSGEAAPKVDYKGFSRVNRGGGNFELTDGNMTVKVETMGGGRLQASFRSAKSSPSLQGEQGAVDWAAAYRDESIKLQAAERKAAAATPQAALDNDFLSELFGQPNGQPKTNDQPTTNKPLAIGDIRAAIKSAIDAAVNARDDWTSREYRTNKKQVVLRGDGPSNQASMSVGSINESKRNKAIESLNQEVAALEKLERLVATDDGASRFLSSTAEIMDTAKRANDSGNYSGSTANEIFEQILLDRLNFRGPGGQGSITSNGLSKAVLSAINATDQSTPEPKAAAKIEDVGAKIGGARKDKWKESGLSVADLNDMSESEGATLAKKANVWKPDYSAMSAATDPVTAAMVKVVYDQLAAQPKDDTPQGRRDYVTAMQAVRKVYSAVTSVEQARDVGV